MTRRNRPVSPARAVACACGRVCASAAGLRTHERKCPVERARSAAFVAAIEAGLSRAALDVLVSATVTAARAGRPLPELPARAGR